MNKMKLPKVEKRKKIDVDRIVRVAKRVKKSLVEEREYLRKKGYQDEDYICPRFNCFS